MNYVFLGDSPTLESGFARVAKNIVPQLNLSNTHFWGIGFDGVANPYNFPIYSANPNSNWQSKENAQRFESFLNSLDGPIILWTMHDPNRFEFFIPILKKFKEKERLKLISYIPVDSYLDESSEKFIKLTDIPVAYTHFGKAQVERFTNKRVLVIPHGNDPDFKQTDVDKALFFPSHLNNKILGVVNSNTSRKNLFRSLEIFYYLHQLDPSWRIYFHVDPNGYYPLQKLGEDMGILDLCIFANPYFDKSRIGVTKCDKETLIKIYNCFDLFLSTSHGEGWGLTATEAASCGVPIAIGRHSSFEEIFDDSSCIYLEDSAPTVNENKIVKDFDAKASAVKIFKEQESREKAEKAKKIVNDFKWEEINLRWKNLLTGSPFNKKRVLVSSGMRVGSTWVGKIVSAMNSGSEEYIFIDKFLSLSEENIEEKFDLICEFFRKIDKNLWVKSHLITPDFFERLIARVEDLKIINIHRNEKDALESRLYYSTFHNESRGLESDIPNFRKFKDTKELYKEAQILGLIKDWKEDLKKFKRVINTKNIITLKYETLREEVGRCVDLIDPEYQINTDQILDHFSFEREQEREIQKTERTGNDLFCREGFRKEGL